MDDNEYVVAESMVPSVSVTSTVDVQALAASVSSVPRPQPQPQYQHPHFQHQDVAPQATTISQAPMTRDYPQPAPQSVPASAAIPAAAPASAEEPLGTTSTTTTTAPSSNAAMWANTTLQDTSAASTRTQLPAGPDAQPLPASQATQPSASSPEHEWSAHTPGPAATVGDSDDITGRQMAFAAVSAPASASSASYPPTTQQAAYLGASGVDTAAAPMSVPPVSAHHQYVSTPDAYAAPAVEPSAADQPLPSLSPSSAMPIEPRVQPVAAEMLPASTELQAVSQPHAEPQPGPQPEEPQAAPAMYPDVGANELDAGAHETPAAAPAPEPAPEPAPAPAPAPVANMMFFNPATLTVSAKAPTPSPTPSPSPSPSAEVDGAHAAVSGPGHQSGGGASHTSDAATATTAATATGSATNGTPEVMPAYSAVQDSHLVYSAAVESAAAASSASTTAYPMSTEPAAADAAAAAADADAAADAAAAVAAGQQQGYYEQSGVGADDGGAGAHEANEWAEAVDQASGRTYYYNVDTMVTAWSLPEGAVLATEDDGSYYEDSDSEADDAGAVEHAGWQ